MQHGHLAVTTLGCQKTSHFDQPTEGCCIKPAGCFTQGQHSEFQTYQALCIVFSLRGAVFQPSLTYRQSGWRVAQSLALDQLSGEFDTVQSRFPYKYPLGSRCFDGNRCSFTTKQGLGLLFLHHRGRSRHGSLHLDDQVAQHSVVELERMLELV